MSAQGRMAGYVLSGLPVAIGGLLMLIAPSYMGALFTPGPWLVLPGDGRDRHRHGLARDSQTRRYRGLAGPGKTQFWRVGGRWRVLTRSVRRVAM